MVSLLSIWSRADARPPEPLRTIAEERSQPVNSRNNKIPPLTMECYAAVQQQCAFGKVNAMVVWRNSPKTSVLKCRDA
jgi:hypothetical protein